MITELEFKSLGVAGFNRIPLIAEAFADLETPLSLYLKLAHARDGGKHPMPDFHLVSSENERSCDFGILAYQPRPSQ